MKAKLDDSNVPETSDGLNITETSNGHNDSSEIAVNVPNVDGGEREGLSLEVVQELKETKENGKEPPKDEQDDEEDLLKSGWLYIDSSGNRQVLTLFLLLPFLCFYSLFLSLLLSSLRWIITSRLFSPIFYLLLSRVHS